MCNLALHIDDLVFIVDIVQPRKQNGPHTTVYFTYIAKDFPTSGEQHHRLAKCELKENVSGSTGINQDFRESAPFSAGTQNFDETCFSSCTKLDMSYIGTNTNAVASRTFNKIAEGGIKYVPNNNDNNNSDYIVIVDTNPPATGTSYHTGVIYRCSIKFSSGEINKNSCDEDPICPERDNRNAFGYFSDCRDSSSCGVYYMGTIPEFTTHNLMNRVYCADIINFSSSEDPIGYRRHFTSVHAFDVARYISTTIQSNTQLMNIRSYQEIKIYPNAMITGNGSIDPATTWFVSWPNDSNINSAMLWNRNSESDSNLGDENSGYIEILGKVTQAHLPNEIVDNYEMLGYYNQTYALPLRRHHWKINAPSIELLGSQVNQSYLLLGNVHMDNTEDWVLYDQIPLGHQSLRVRHEYHGSGLRHLEVVNCTQKFNFTTTLNCTHLNQNINVSNHGVLLALSEHISRVWKFDESIVVLTHTPRNVTLNATNSTNSRSSRISIYNKKAGTWTSRNLAWSGYNVNTEVLEYIDCVEHEGDIHFALKWNVYYATSNGEDTGSANANKRWITTPIRFTRAYGLNCSDPKVKSTTAKTGGWREISRTIPRYRFRPYHHPTLVNSDGSGNLDHGWTNYRFNPLEDDTCVTGFNIVQDDSWRVRFLLDCNRRARNGNTMNTRRMLQAGINPTNNEWGNGKWIGDYFLFDNSVMNQYRTIWNITLRNGEASNYDLLGDDWEEGCATREHVFMFDRTGADDGWVLAAVHMHHLSVRMFELQR